MHMASMRHTSAFPFLSWLLLLSLLPAGVAAQHTTVAQADSLAKLLREGKADTNRVNILLRLSTYYGRKSWNAAQNRDTALTLARQAHALSQQLEYARGEEEAVFREGRVLIQQENMGAVRGLLGRVSAVNRVRLLLELGKQRWQDSHAHQADLDTTLVLFHQAEQLSESLKNGQWKEESQFLLGVIYFLKKDIPKSKSYFNGVIEACRRADDKAGEARALLRMLNFVMYTARECQGEECAERLSALNRAVVLSQQMKDKALEVICLNRLGTYYSQQKDYSRLKQVANQAVSIQKQIGYPALSRAWHVLTDETEYHSQSFFTSLSNAHYLLTEMNEDLDDIDQTLFNYFQGVREVEQSGLHEDLAYPYAMIGLSYADLNQIDKSIEYYQKSLAVSRAKGEAVVFNGLIRWLADALLKQGKAREALQVLKEYNGQNLPLAYASKTLNISTLAKCYSALKQYAQAEKYFLQAISRSEQGFDKPTNTTVQYAAIQFYVETGQYRKAQPLLKEVLDRLNKPGRVKDEFREADLLQFKVDSALGNYPSAIKHYQRYTALRDSIFNETKSKQIEELGIKYETEKKEQALRLQEKDNARLTAQNQAQQTTRNALLGGSGLLLALLGLSYNRYRLKQRSNQLLEAQQEALRARQAEIDQQNTSLELLLMEKEFLLKEIHHRVKNNLQVVMSLLSAQAAGLQDQAALSAIQESQHRVHTMALLHQQLYQGEQVARIPMQAYLQELVSYLREAYERPQIGFALQVEALELDVAVAVPLGLIVNEALTNALKYAFPNGREGTIKLSLYRCPEAEYHLLVEDDGVGLPAGYVPERDGSLGMTLIRGFSRQLGGQLCIRSDAGLVIDLTFQEEALVPARPHADYAY
jgi:two-component sensor histidine kinase